MLILRVGAIPLRADESGLLTHAGIRCERTSLGQDIPDFLRMYDFDLVLVDLNLPDMRGDDAIRVARAAGLSTPAILLARVATPEVKVSALDRGADDVVMMPCDPDELMARVRAVARRSRAHADSTLKCGPVELSLSRHEVRVRGQNFRVTRREFAILELLFLKRTVLNRTAFLDHVYGGLDEAPTEKNIDVMICRLRKKLSEAGVPNLIDTVWGSGHILREP